ncbi:MAG: SWIM zinc finger family protein [Chloroflexi bacterium]|nr:SWIM zinc finger family protein [Chloroflexota bacterium]
MHSSLISKIEKARRYAQERDRIAIQEFTASFRGDHSSYAVTYRQGTWGCSCPFFSGHGLCSHTMALEHILEGMVLAGSAARG